MVSRVLFVCAANVCRSPLMAAAFGAAWHAPLPIDITSRGISVRAARSICDVSAGVLAAKSIPAVGGVSHLSRGVTEGDVRIADLIIAASSAERQALAQIHAGARTRTFTLREALALTADAQAEGELAGISSLGEYADRINACRGMVSDDPADAKRWGRRTAAADIPDVHGSIIFTHRRILTHTATAAAELSSQLSTILMPSPELAYGSLTPDTPNQDPKVV